MTEEPAPNPLDDPEITIEAIDTVMRMPPLELAENPEQRARVIERLRRHREGWAKAQERKASRQAGGVGRRKTTKGTKAAKKMTEEDKATMEDLLGDLMK